MSTFKYTGSTPIELTHYELRLQPGQTFQIPDTDDVFLEQQPEFESSRAKNPDLTSDTSTGTIPVQVAPVHAAPVA